VSAPPRANTARRRRSDNHFEWRSSQKRRIVGEQAFGHELSSTVLSPSIGVKDVGVRLSEAKAESPQVAAPPQAFAGRSGSCWVACQVAEELTTEREELQLEPVAIRALRLNTAVELGPTRFLQEVAAR